MLLNKIKKYDVVLASQSPRRQELLKGLGVEFKVIIKSVDESFPDDLPINDIPIFLSELKSDAFNDEFFSDNTLLITADTIVIIDGKVLGKPKDREDAINIIKKLSGNKHVVLTGVCIRTKNKKHSFVDNSNVYFRNINNQEIEWYIDNFKPYDKAGAYGVQEWIGYIGIEKIEGSFYNVMGLPTQKLYSELDKFID